MNESVLPLLLLPYPPPPAYNLVWTTIRGSRIMLFKLLFEVELVFKIIIKDKFLRQTLK